MTLTSTEDISLYKGGPPRPLGTVEAEIKVLSVERSELKGSPFKAWSRSVYSHACHGYCHSSLLIFTLPVHSPTYFPNLSRVFLVLAAASTGSCASLQNKIGHPARRYRQMMQVPVFECSRNINRPQNMFYCISGLKFRDCEYNFDFPGETSVFCEI